MKPQNVGNLSPGEAMGGGYNLVDPQVDGGKELLSRTSLGAGGSAQGRVQL